MVDGSSAVAAFERYRELVDDFERFAAACVAPLPTCVWANPARVALPELRDRLAAQGLDPQLLGWHPLALRIRDDELPGHQIDFLGGRCHVQEEVSLVPPVLLDARPGERVIDLCAAPGGKTALIAMAMQGCGTLIANDRNIHRIRALRAVTERLGLCNVITTVHNAPNLSRGMGTFDRVLADVPCTGEGTSRKNPRVLTEDGERDRSRMVTLQLAILRRAVSICRPGGRIVYSTCTYAPEENEGVVDTVLREQAGALTVLPITIPGLRTAPGIGGWRGRAFHADLRHALRLWPHHGDRGGFFAVAMERSPLAPVRDTPESQGELPQADPEVLRACLALLEERFCIAADHLDRLRFFACGRKLLGMADRSMIPPPMALVNTCGQHFFHISRAAVMPTSSTARMFGALARRNVVDLHGAQLAGYVGRERVVLGADQVSGGASRGAVFVMCNGVGLGCGFLREVADGWELESFFPKHLARASAP